MPKKPSPNFWTKALSVWNKKSKNVYCVPRKGSKQFAEVKAIERRLKKQAKKN